MDHSKPAGDKLSTLVTFLTRFHAQALTISEQVAAEASSPFYQSAFKKYSLATIYSHFFEYTNGTLHTRQAEERTALLSLMTLGGLYANEMMLCSEAGAKLSAVVMSCSLLETMLMMSCFRHKKIVIETKTWSKSWRNRDG